MQSIKQFVTLIMPFSELLVTAQLQLKAW